MEHSVEGMHIHCYSHDISPAIKDAYDSGTVSALLEYLQHGGREYIALWRQTVENRIWQGGHPLLAPGVSLVYSVSRN